MYDETELSILGDQTELSTLEDSPFRNFNKIEVPSYCKIWRYNVISRYVGYFNTFRQLSKVLEERTSRKTVLASNTLAIRGASK